MVRYRFAVAVVLLALAACWLPAPMGEAAPAVSAADVRRAIGQLEPMLLAAMEKTGVPGVAVGVVYEDRLFWAAGYGVREVGKPQRPARPRGG